jgi:hypothetical protein
MPTAGGQVLWSDLKAIGDAVDALATTLAIPSTDYLPLKNINDTPFPLSATVAASFGYRFFMTGSPGSMAITDHYIVTALGPGGSTYQMPNATLAQLASDGYLYFVNTADGCWCKTIFLVNQQGTTTPNGEKWRLEAVGGDMGCCQTLDVPDVGDLLDSDQHFIPAAYITDYTVVPFPGVTPQWVYGPRCQGDASDNVDYELVQNPAVGTQSNVQLATRQMSGYFTWPVKQDWLNWIVGNINSILAICCGAKENSVKNRSTGNYVSVNCPVSFDDLCYTLGVNHPDFTGQPGCITDAAGWFNGCGAGSGSCSGQLLYAATLVQLQQLITDMPGQLQPYQSTCPTCSTCYVGDTMNMVSSGFSDCDCNLGYTNQFSIEEINGLDSVTLFWNSATNSYIAENVGSATVNYYDDVNCTEMDSSYPVDGTFTITATCNYSTAGVPISWGVSIEFIPEGSQAVLGAAWGSNYGQLNSPISGPNCYNPISNTGTAGQLFGGGTVTLIVPT